MADFELKVLECGHTTLDYELAVTADPDEIVMGDRRSRDRRLLRHPVYAYVIEHPDGRVLVDTGINSNFTREWKNEFYQQAMAYDPGPDGLFLQRLKEHGLTPGDFEHVVVTHLHTDHAGNLRSFAPTSAQIFVGESELRGAVDVKGGLLREDLVTLWGVTSPQGFTRADFSCLLPDRATQVFADFELLRNVWIVSIPGHTWGTLGVAINLPNEGWMLLASDAIYLAATWGRRFRGNILNQFPSEWAKSASKIKSLAMRYEMKILPGHDDQVIVPDAGGGHEVVGLQTTYR